MERVRRPDAMSYLSSLWRCDGLSGKELVADLHTLSIDILLQCSKYATWNFKDMKLQN